PALVWDSAGRGSGLKYRWAMKNEPATAELEKPTAVADKFLHPVVQLEKQGRADSALDVLYDRVDDLLKAKQFATVDDLLRQAHVDLLSVDVLLGLLTATVPARSRLLARS